MTSPITSPNKKHIKDPYTSLDFSESHKDGRRDSPPRAGAQRASAKPPPREMSELFAAGRTDDEPPRSGRVSPMKENMPSAVAPKGAGGQKFQASRLFDADAEPASPVLYKSHPAKYDHFDLGDAHEHGSFKHNDEGASDKKVPMRAKTNKHMSQWGFDDSVTPEKLQQKVRGQDVRHFGWGDDEGEPAKHLGQHSKPTAPRPDAKAHFEFQDEGTPPGDKRPAGRPKGSQHNKGLGLYQSTLYQEDGNSTAADGPLKTLTNHVGRKNAFDSHFSMTNSSPANGSAHNENKPMGDDRKKAVNMMGSHWDNYDQSPEANQKIGNTRLLRKAPETHWDFADEDVKPVAGRKE